MLFYNLDNRELKLVYTIFVDIKLIAIKYVHNRTNIVKMKASTFFRNLCFLT